MFSYRKSGAREATEVKEREKMRKGSVEQKRVYAGMNCGAEQSTRGAKETGEDHYHNFIQRRKISHV